MKIPIPDTQDWAPRSDAAETLASAFLRNCSNAEVRLGQALRQENEMAVDAFDSGLPFEAAVRSEIENLLPGRYEVTSGVVLDSNGNSAGQADVIVFNDSWFPMVKKPVSAGAGEAFFPVEGVYAIGEVKQTLSVKTFDAAMKKLVVCQRLVRPRTFANRLVENREADSCPHGLTNPLCTFLFAGRMEKGTSFESLVNRFFDICKQLKRLEVVRALCVPGEGFVTWVFRDPLRKNEIRPALFMKDDLFHEIIPAYVPCDRQPALFGLVALLHAHLHKAVLAPEDVISAYGPADYGGKLPKSSQIALAPDPEWVSLLEIPCNDCKE